MAAFDLVIRGGTVVDGTGGDPVDADVAVAQGRIVAMGKGLGRGVEEIEAKGMLVTPGFVDVHTHYDGQAAWDDRLQPSTQHGATTVIMGNCGVGFAPCRAQDRDALVSLMEGVEDIPHAVLADGLPWNWESFPEYLDALERRRFDADVAAFVPHGPVRVYAMGRRAIDREPASEADVAAMRALVTEALAVGAVGFSTSRTLAHRTAEGALVPTYQAAHTELTGIGGALASSPGAAFQMITDWDDPEAEFAALAAIVGENGAHGTFTLLQNDFRPDLWREVAGLLEAARARGLAITAQALSRPIGVLMGLEASLHPFRFRPSYKRLAGLPLAERLAALRDPAVKAAILAEEDDSPQVFIQYFGKAVDRFFLLGARPDYLPSANDSVGARARAQGRDPFDLLYDDLLADDGHALIYLPIANYTAGDAGVIEAMLTHPHTMPALGDGGAHVGSICDASAATFLLTEWVRDRQVMTLPEAIARLTSVPAGTFRLNDRGRIAPGLKADLNVIDLDGLSIERPRIAHDLPGGGRRLLQDARGYRASVVSGEITWRDGAGKQARPGRLVRVRPHA